jgi:hypothetical protein
VRVCVYVCVCVWVGACVRVRPCEASPARPSRGSPTSPKTSNNGTDQNNTDAEALQTSGRERALYIAALLRGDVDNQDRLRMGTEQIRSAEIGAAANRHGYKQAWL